MSSASVEIASLVKYWEHYFNDRLFCSLNGQNCFDHRLKLTYRKVDGKFLFLDNFSLKRVKELVSSEWFEEHVQIKVMPDKQEHSESYY